MAENQLKWTPGNNGKGLITDEGAVWTWDTDGGEPHHAEMLTGDMSDTIFVHKNHAAFQIDPDGRVHLSILTYADRDKCIKTILDADSRLYAETQSDNDWKFASYIDRSPYVDELLEHLDGIEPKEPEPLSPHHDTQDHFLSKAWKWVKR